MMILAMKKVVARYRSVVQVHNQTLRLEPGPGGLADFAHLPGHNAS
jgi:hypothetical protein